MPRGDFACTRIRPRELFKSRGFLDRLGSCFPALPHLIRYQNESLPHWKCYPRNEGIQECFGRERLTLPRFPDGPALEVRWF